MQIRKTIQKIKYLIELSEAEEFVQRYFVMNAFDGVLTIIGVIIGSYATLGVSPKQIISAGLGASVAIGVSGFTGTYMAETAERELELKKIGKKLLRKMKGSLQEEAARIACIWSAIVGGSSPALVSLICILPFLAANYNLIPPQTSLHASLLLCGLVLFGLGSYLGKISKENTIKWGFKVLIIGGIVAVFSSLITRIANI